ncbi:CR2 protein, partial [Rhinopomastus cyanomelas]|nr:CR2 protein [Rhinopomastus cyanomelas]
CLPVAVRPCPMPPAIAHGHHSGQGRAFFTTGMAVTYSCAAGYYLVGKATAFCRASGNWSQPGPRCEEVTCPRPPNIPNGLHSGLARDSFPQGATVSYSCKQGYQLLGNRTITCSESGEWSRAWPRCEGG